MFVRGQSVQAGRGRADGLCDNGVAAPYDHEMALPGGLEPPACGLGNRRSVLMSYGSSLPGRRRGSPVRTAARLHPRITRTEFAQTGSYATRMWWFTAKNFVKLPLAGSCPGRVSAALGCVPLSASPLLFERQSFQRPFGPWSGSISTWRRQIRNRFRPILEIRGPVSLRARLAGATGLRSARLSVLRDVIGESWTGVSPVL